jgi:D-alanyl-D-alanine carboxypeptidase/D-alanyl-D-alanine-endopeptidase (penicillin-binding protein 4)
VENLVETQIPFIHSDSLVARLLSDTLRRPVQLLSSTLGVDYEVIYSQPVDSMYKIIMQQSDNFIAEQILLLCSSEWSDSLSSRITIGHMMKNWLNDLVDQPNWVDGSGLSRYNLATPRSIVRLWEKIYNEVPRSRLFPLLAQGGKVGTLREWYKSDSPFVFGKTGTLSNNHCLSVFLITRKGKTYIFSFMNSHYVRKTEEIKKKWNRS